MVAENEDLSATPLVVGKLGGVGALLRETRVQRGQDVGTVATALRIRQSYLEAIEDGRFSDLPGSTYAVGFIRGYAEFLGLDSKEIIRRFHQENGEFNGRAELVFPSAVSEGSIPTGALLGLAVLAAAVAYGGWYWYQSRNASVATTVSPLPERLASLINRPVGSGSELVPVVQQGDAGKVNEIPQPPAAATSSTPAVPTVVPAGSSQAPASQTPSTASSAAQGGPPREDVVPPSEDDGSASAPAASDNQSVADAKAPVPGGAEGRQPDGKAPDVKGRDAKNRDARAARPAEPPGDAAVTPDAANGALAVAPATTGDQPGKAKGRGRAGQTEAARGAAVAPADGAAAPATSGPSTTTSSPTTSGQPSSSQASGAPSSQPGPGSTGSPAGSDAAEGAAGAGGRVMMTAKEDCWIQIRDAHGKVVQKRLLRKGESYAVPRRSGLTMTVGNAGALAVQVDGKPIPSLGGIGMVRRDLSLDADRLANGTESPAPADPSATPATDTAPSPSPSSPGAAAPAGGQ